MNHAGDAERLERAARELRTPGARRLGQARAVYMREVDAGLLEHLAVAKHPGDPPSAGRPPPFVDAEARLGLEALQRAAETPLQRAHQVPHFAEPSLLAASHDQPPGARRRAPLRASRISVGPRAPPVRPGTT